MSTNGGTKGMNITGNGKWSVKVFGPNYLNGPMLDSDDVKTVAFTDQNGDVQAAVVRMDDSTFVFGSAAQSDWDQFKRRFGL